jgi:hypothetical protein
MLLSWCLQVVKDIAEPLAKMAVEQAQRPFKETAAYLEEKRQQVGCRAKPCLYSIGWVGYRCGSAWVAAVFCGLR